MTGKGHCRFDVSKEDSEFAEFYNFSDPDDSSDSGDGREGEESNQDETTTNSYPRPVLADEDSVHLPSGRTILKKSTESLFTGSCRRPRTLTSQIEYSVAEPTDDDVNEDSNKDGSNDTSKSRALSKREKREKAMITYQLVNMSANDRNGLTHLPSSQQRAILAAQHRHADKMQKIERRRQTRIERKGNKNLYAYWHTETPVYQCG